MEALMSVSNKLSLAVLLGFLMASAGHTAVNDKENLRQVRNVKWHKTETVNVNEIKGKEIPFRSASVFFLRQKDNDGIQSSANIAINDRFQVSLQPGNFSQVYSCVGVNQISADITGNKSNDLLRNFTTFKLEPNVHYFFEVDVDDTGLTIVKHITENKAMSLLKDMQYQSHQITRVVPNCPVEAPEPSRVPLPPPVVPTKPAEVNKVQYENIELRVLFDNDKSFVKPHYYAEIERVAQFMQRHPEATATIEGHTDSNASDMYNVRLSQRRVDAVKKILVENYGVSANRLNSIGYGESRPVASNATPEGRQQNRRVVVVFQAN